MQKLAVTIEGRTFEIEIETRRDHSPTMVVKVDGEPVRVVLPELDGSTGDMEWIVIDDRPYEINFDRQQRRIRDHRGSYSVELRELDMPIGRPRLGSGPVKAPIPGQITRVMVQEGQRVEAGQPLLILEAMKMANEIRAPHAGVVKSVHVAPRDKVKRDTLLVEIE